MADRHGFEVHSSVWTRLGQERREPNTVPSR